MGDRVRRLLERWGAWVLLALALIVVLPTAQLLIEAFDGLLLAGTDFAAIDLRLRVREVTGWWSGTDIYKTSGHAVYPPAAYVILRALFVFDDFERIRWVWGAWTLLGVLLASWGTVRAVGAKRWQAVVFVAVLPLAVSGMHGGIANGQVSLLCTLAAVGSVLLLTREDAGWGTDLLAAGLFLVALIKPTMTAPLFWLVCFVPGRWRPAVLVVVGYALLTVIGCLAIPDESMVVLLARWADRAIEGSRYGALDGGSVNMQTAMGLARLSLHAPVVVLALVGLVGAWAAGRPSRDPWILMGVAGVVARLAFYHRTYDDLIVLPALIALARAARRPATGRWPLDLVAGGLLVVTWGVMCVQDTHWFLEGPRDGITWIAWVATGLFLVFLARQEDDGEPA